MGCEGWTLSLRCSSEWKAVYFLLSPKTYVLTFAAYPVIQAAARWAPKEVAKRKPLEPIGK
jgi:hypothetical protein